MEVRLDYTKAAPEGFRAMLAVERFLHSSGLEDSLLHLIKLRASQVNGCAYCIDMHSKDARANGETEQRLYGLDAWREAPYYTERERAALALTEAVTKVTEGHVPDAVYIQAKAQFSEAELATLVFAIATINAWNRLAITFRSEAGQYQPAKKAAA